MALKNHNKIWRQTYKGPGIKWMLKNLLLEQMLGRSD